MELSFFLAKVFGFYLLITSAMVFTRKETFAAVIKEFYRNPALILISAVINVILGLLIVVGHNVWTPDWRVIITLFGYMCLAKGLIHFYRPEWLQKLATKMVKGNGYTYSAFINLILGLVLLYFGFGLG